MDHKRKKTVMITGAAIALIAMAAIAAVFLLDINSHKPRIETAASEATGLDVRIHSNLGLSFFPFGFSAKDIHVADNGVEVLSLEKLKLGVAILPLLKKQLHIHRCELYKPVITIVNDAGKKPDREHAGEKVPKKGMGTGFRLEELEVSHGTLIYMDRETAEKTEARNIHLAVADLRIAGTPADIVRRVSFTGHLDCREVRKGVVKIDHINSPVRAAEGVFSLTPLTMDIFGGKGQGNVTMDKSGENLVVKIDLKISKLDFADLSESFGAKKAVSGRGDLDTSLILEGPAGSLPMRRMNGHFSLQGDHLTTHTMDPDKILSTYETSQEFNLVDLGAFFIAGPLGTAGIRGYRYWNVYEQTREGQGEIARLVSRWNIRSGMAQSVDCALATRHHRVALTGRLDLVNNRYDDVTVALLDDGGCAKFKQRISGAFARPEIGTVGTAETLAGPVIQLYKKAKRFLKQERCEVFYNGSVRHP